MAESSKQKVLYISDLDGTLLNKNAELSGYTAESLNSLLARGMYFTVATARTDATVAKLLEKLKLNVPAVLMNGVVIYDLQKKQYVKLHRISPYGLESLIDAVSLFSCSGFMYCICDGRLTAYYCNLDAPNSVGFMRERQQKFGKSFVKVESFNDCPKDSVVYFSVSDKRERLLDAYKKLSGCEQLHVEFYRDIYNTDSWYLEICSCEASKYNAVNYLRQVYGFDRIVGFGDNLNDLPLFKACDEAYAVDNAKPEVKAEANGVIGTNEADAVADFLLQQLGEK